MNTKAGQSKLLRCARITAALLTGIFLISKAPAQPATAPVESRFLLVFNTASDMKKRLPAERRALNTLLANSMRGELHAGDSIAVWTFGRELRAEHLVQTWVPENAATISSNIFRFVAKQRYSKKTSFDVLLPSLNRVVQNSDRLTVVIFCDGDGEIVGTPYDFDIRQAFQQQQADRKKARQPFIIVLRSQLGRYVGCTIDWPAGLVSLPAFPPLPPPPNEPASAPPSPPPPVVTAPPLIVIGTKARTNLPPPAPAPLLQPATNQPPPRP